jgi:hypothetical protein
MNQPHIVDRAILQDWAWNGDANAEKWLNAYPDAIFFGVDDDNIHVWFATQAQAKKWLADMQADAAEQPWL